MKSVGRARLSSLVLMLAGVLCFVAAAGWNSSRVAASRPTPPMAVFRALPRSDPSGIVVQYQPGTSEAAIAELEASLGIARMRSTPRMG